MDLLSIYIKQNGRRKFRVPEVTEFLKQYGLSKSDFTTTKFIRYGELYAELDKPNQKGSGYVIKERDLYDFIISKIPAAEILLELAKEKYEPKTEAKTAKKTTKTKAKVKPLEEDEESVKRTQKMIDDISK